MEYPCFYPIGIRRRLLLVIFVCVLPVFSRGQAANCRIDWRSIQRANAHFQEFIDDLFK